MTEVWVENPDQEEITFNKRGVRLVIEQIEIFTLKSFLLSRYEPERINKILMEFGFAFSDFIHNNAEELGMNTEYKQSKFKLVVLNVVFLIEGALRRAIGGAESNANAPNISVHQLQNDNSQGLPFNNNQVAQKKWQWL